MVQWGRWLFLFAVVGFDAVAVPPALAQSGPPRKVLDDAGMFSDAAKAKTNAQIAALKQRVKKDLLVETVLTVKRPKDLDKTDPKAVNAFFDKWANERFKDHRVNGVYIGIVKVPPKFRVAVGPTTSRIGLFTRANRQELQKIMLANLKKGAPDDALVEGTNYVVTTMTTNAKTIDANKSKKTADKKSSTRPAWPPWMGYLCIGLVVLLGVWLVVGLVRAFSGGGGGGAGGGGYGGGGGGFFPSLMGGLFGAMAGMWLYNNMFGGNAHAANDLTSGGPDQPADDYGTDVGQDADVGGDDYGGGDWGDNERLDGGGGDWGDNDFGGGGGDWGGGDFGGGDW